MATLRRDSVCLAGTKIDILPEHRVPGMLSASKWFRQVIRFLQVMENACALIELGACVQEFIYSRFK